MSMQVDPSHTAEIELFDDVLSHQARLSAAFVPGTSPDRLAHAEHLLRTVALIEDHRSEDSQNERIEDAPFGQRLEAKLDLGLLMLGRLLEYASPPLRARDVRWSILGARLQQPDAASLPPGSEGVLQIQPCDWLPESLELPASILATDSGHWVWLSFPVFSPGLRDALERHLFRQHRRQIAQTRTDR